jgi:hypothetical protein
MVSKIFSGFSQAQTNPYTAFSTHHHLKGRSMNKGHSMNHSMKHVRQAALWLVAFALCAGGFNRFALAQQQVTMQVIHASADPAANLVDVWVGTPVPGGQPAFGRVLTNFAFRTGTAAFTGINPVLPTLPSGVAIRVNITAPNSTAATPALVSVDSVILGRGANIVLARGVSNPSMFAPNPNGRSTALNLTQLFDTTTNIPSTQTRLILYHAVTDAPRVELVVREIPGLPAIPLAYDEAAVATVPVGNYTIDIRLPGSTTPLMSFAVPLRDIATGGRRAIVTVTGFFNPATNRGGAAIGMNLYTETQMGGITLFPAGAAAPPVQQPPISFQAIHNAADTALARVGVWIGLPQQPPAGTLFLPVLPNFAFRTGSPRLTSVAIPGMQTVPLAAIQAASLQLNITAANAASATPALQTFSNYQLQNGANYLIAYGILPNNVSGYAANPNMQNTRFGLGILTDPVTQIDGNLTRLLVFHSSTDAPRVEILVRGSGVLGNQAVQFGQVFAIDTPTDDYILDVREAGTTRVLRSYRANLRTLQLAGQRVMILASGFWNPAQNRNGQPFGLLAVVNNEMGTSFMLPEVTTSVQARNEVSGVLTIHSTSPSPAADQTLVRYSVEQAGAVAIKVINSLGQTVFQTDPEHRSVGEYSFALDVSTWASGAYTVQVLHNGRTAISRFIVRR